MPAPIWIDRAVVLAVHEVQLAEHGGLAGVRDAALLDSALARPQMRHAYESPSLAELAACYAFGIARNHPLLDGNKRTSLVAMELFLELNGIELLVSDVDCVTTILALAAGELDEPQLAVWIEANSRQST